MVVESEREEEESIEWTNSGAERWRGGDESGAVGEQEETAEA